MSTNVANPVQPCPQKSPEKEAQNPKKFWVKIQVTDAKDNKPIENVVLDLGLPKDLRTIVVTDEKGQFEINNIENGTCQLYSDWRELIDSGYTIEQMLII
jgi:hypothetical protein